MKPTPQWLEGHEIIDTLKDANRSLSDHARKLEAELAQAAALLFKLDMQCPPGAYSSETRGELRKTSERLRRRNES